MATVSQNQTAIAVVPMLSMGWEDARGNLQTTLTSMSMALNGLISTQGLSDLNSDWTDVPWTPGEFFCNSTGSITALEQRPYTVCFKILGPVMHLFAAFTLSVNNGTTTEIHLAIPLPAGYSLRTLPALANIDDNRIRTAAIWNGGPTAGVAGAFVNYATTSVEMQRWDGTAAAGYPAAQCFFGFQIFIPVVPPATAFTL